MPGMIDKLCLKIASAALPTQLKSLARGVLPSLLVLSGALPLLAQVSSSVTLAWDPNLDPNTAGYRLYMGTTSQVYTNEVDVGNVTNATISGLTMGATYYFALTDYANDGLESAYSGEISFTPTVSSPTIALTSPANNSSYVAPATINLAAGVVANGHTIVKVQFFSGATLLAESTTAPYGFTWNNVPAGNYSLSATTVYDSTNLASSGAVNVTVTAPSNSITIAASSGTISPPFVVSNGIVFQTVATGVTNGGRAAYSFSVPATGDYVVSANINAPNDGANSFYVNIDAEPTDPTMIWDCALSSDFTNETVCWRGNGTPDQSQFAPKVFNLAQGTHQLIVRGREANTLLAAITISPAFALPLPWQAVDVGNVSIAGSASATNGLFTVTGAGTLSGSSDSFRFLYQPMSGNGEVRAQVNSIQGTNSGARAGVMIRETLTAGSRYAFIGLAPSGKVYTQRRSKTAGSTSSSGSTALGLLPNLWVRVVRTSNTFYCYESTDGVNWVQVAYPSITMATSVYAGIAVASGSTTTMTSSTFTNVVFVP